MKTSLRAYFVCGFALLGFISVCLMGYLRVAGTATSTTVFVLWIAIFCSSNAAILIAYGPKFFLIMMGGTYLFMLSIGIAFAVAFAFLSFSFLIVLCLPAGVVGAWLMFKGGRRLEAENAERKRAEQEDSSKTDEARHG